MPKTYAELSQQIQALQAEAEAVFKEEMVGVVARIREAIEVYGLTADDLGLGAKGLAGGPSAKKTAAATKVPGRKAAAKKSRSAVKYQDSAGHSWTGMGPKPGWLKEMLAAGTSLESLRVGGASNAEPAEAPSAGRQPAAKKKSQNVKYQDDAGNAWSGRGPKPRWLKDLMDAGKSLDDFAV